MSSTSTKNVEHIIESGDTLGGIASQNNVSLEDLLAANPDIQDANRIRIGQVIVIPSQAAPAVEPDEPSDGQPQSPEPDKGNEERSQSGADPNAILFLAESLGASDGTARQDKLPQQGITGVKASEAMAQTDRKRVMKHKAKFEEAARKFNAPPALLAAIASRESRGGAVLDSKGFGDHGRGFGLMQVDIGNPFPVEQNGGPAGQPHINQATTILKDKLQTAKHRFPDLSDVEQLQAAVSRYNGGSGLPPPNSDKGTTGGDYMNDVWARARFYARVEEWTV
jgi:LysM repeat protein